MRGDDPPHPPRAFHSLALAKRDLMRGDDPPHPPRAFHSLALAKRDLMRGDDPHTARLGSARPISWAA